MGLRLALLGVPHHLRFFFSIHASTTVVVYPFSFSNVIGNTAGTVSGLIYGLADNTAGQPASDLVITSVPLGFAPLPFPTPFSAFAYSVWLMQNQWAGSAIASNSFDVANGVITSALFQIAGGYLDINVGSTINVLVSSDTLPFEAASGSAQVQNNGGFAALTFGIPLLASGTPRCC
jgi:hypothetical protein